MKLLGKPVDFETLLRAEYISSRRGSSMADLMKAAADHGLYCQPVARMTCHSLRYSDCPVILNVKSSAGGLKYNHWVVYAGESEAGVRIYDGSKEIHFGSCRELAAEWGGVGLLISAKPIRGRRMMLVGMSELLYWAGVVVLLVGIAFRVRDCVAGYFRGVSVATSTALQSFVVVTISVLAALSAAACREGGYLADQEAVSRIQDANYANFLRHTDFDAVVSAVEQRSAILVDARWKHDFDHGHIPGAVNVEPNTTAKACLSLLSGVSKSASVIVYCQTDACPYSGMVARTLENAGFRDVRLYKEGWREWDSRTNAPARDG